MLLFQTVLHPISPIINAAFEKTKLLILQCDSINYIKKITKIYTKIYLSNSYQN